MASGINDSRAPKAPPTAPFTIRVGLDETVISTDAGDTWVLPASQHDALHAVVKGGTPTTAVASAAARAAFGEADALTIIDADDCAVGPMRLREHWVERIPAFEGAGRVTARPVLSRPLREVLRERTSVLNDGPVDVAKVASVVAILLEMRLEIDDAAGRHWRSRTVPSAGGTHSIEPLVYISTASDRTDGWYRQGRGSLVPITLPSVTQCRLLTAVSGALRRDRPPPAMLVAVADTRLLFERYPNGASLLWRDAGAFLAIAQLLATDLGMSSTIAGVSVRLEDVDPPVQTVGALAMGPG